LIREKIFKEPRFGIKLDFKIGIERQKETNDEFKHLRQFQLHFIKEFTFLKNIFLMDDYHLINSVILLLQLVLFFLEIKVLYPK